MYTLSRQNQEQLLKIALKHTNSRGWMSDAWAIGLYDGDELDKLLSITVFQNISTDGAEAHFAGIAPGWNSKRAMTNLYRVAFDPKLMGYAMLTTVIPADRVDVQIFCLKNGFRFDGRRRAGLNAQSEVVIMTMTPEECRFLPPKRQPQLVLDEENFLKGA